MKDAFITLATVFLLLVAVPASADEPQKKFATAPDVPTQNELAQY